MANNEKIPYFCRVVLQNFPFIEEDFDALTTYQLISKVVEYLNKVIKSQNTLVDNVNNLSSAFQQLHDYVENYFDNLDVQEEINNKLDQMAEDGTLQEIITAYIQANVAWTFDTVADMKASTNLVSGSFAQTLGFHSIGDGGGAIYKITDSGTANEMDIIAIGDLRANLVINGDIKPELFGAYGDGTHNDSNSFNRCLAYTASKEISYNNQVTAPTIKLTKDYVIDKLSIPQAMSCVNIIGEKARIRGGGFNFNSSTGWKVRIEGIIFDTCEDPIDMDYRNLEYGRYEVVNCIFNLCTGIAVNIDRRSAQTLVERCTFRGCEKSVKCSNSDLFMFYNNWVECLSQHPWGDNHYDVEHYVPYGGSMRVKDNLFVPGHVQTATNPCWIKAGGSAVIENNRFSGENTSIHPLYISYDMLSSFNINTSVYPIIDFINNPNVTGNCPIVLGKTVGAINIKNNTGWAGGLRILICENAEATSYYQDLDYSFFTLSVNDNTGRSFNYKNDRGIGLPALYGQSIDTVLQRFIKTALFYQEKYNYEIKASIDNYTLTFEYGTTNLKQTDVFLVSGDVNKNPGGTDYYEPFLALVTIERYYDTELRYRANTQIITKNNQGVSFDTTINGQSYITTLPANEKVTFSLVGSGTARANFKSVEKLNLVPIENKVCN